MSEDAEAALFQAPAHAREQAKVLETAAREDNRPRLGGAGAGFDAGERDSLVEGGCDLGPVAAGCEIVVYSGD